MVRLDALDHHPCAHLRPDERGGREGTPTSATAGVGYFTASGIADGSAMMVILAANPGRSPLCRSTLTVPGEEVMGT
jgi:hypothetical protein